LIQSFGYDTHLHNLFLFKIAYDRTMAGNKVKVDYTNGENGNLWIGGGEGLLLIKALSESRSFPITAEEVSNLANFRHALLCFFDGDSKIQIYTISVDNIISICKNWKIKDPSEVKWITPEDYFQFKRDHFTM
jgi:hypothetical protein